MFSSFSIDEESGRNPIELDHCNEVPGNQPKLLDLHVISSSPFRGPYFSLRKALIRRRLDVAVPSITLNIVSHATTFSALNVDFAQDKKIIPNHTVLLPDL